MNYVENYPDELMEKLYKIQSVKERFYNYIYNKKKVKDL